MLEESSKKRQGGACSRGAGVNLHTCLPGKRPGPEEGRSNGIKVRKKGKVGKKCSAFQI